MAAGRPRKRRKRTKKNASGKGALIKGMSRRLPGELLKDPLFRARLKAIKWSYSVNKGRGEKNMQSMAEAIAKHLK